MIELGLRSALGAVAGWLCLAGSAPAQAPNRLLSVDDLYSPVTVDSPALSPDGTRLVIASAAGTADEPLTVIRTFELSPGAITQTHAFGLAQTVNWVRWANDRRLLISTRTDRSLDEGFAFYLSEEGGIAVTDEVAISYIVGIDPDGTSMSVMYLAQGRELSLNQMQLDRIVDLLPGDPDHILMQVRSSRLGALDVYRVNVNTGAADKVDSGRPQTVAWFSNEDGVTVMRLDLTARYRDLAVLIRDRDGQRWRRVAQQSVSAFSQLQEGVEWVARSAINDEALVLSPDSGTGTVGLFRFDLNQGALGEPLLRNAGHDVHAVRTDPITGMALSASWADERIQVVSFDAQTARHLPAIQRFFGPEIVASPVQRAGDVLLLEVIGPQQPLGYYLYWYSATHLEPLGLRQPELAERALSPVSVHRYTARDGTQLFGYLTHPLSRSFSHKALVVMPHGGPEARDHYTFDDIPQLLAAQGYLVFQPQFRGSSGFGRAFTQAGHAQWGGLIQTDIADGVRSVMAAQGVSPGRVCIAGFSFGGYAALMQPILEPGLYRCAAAGAAVTDLAALLEWEEERADARDERLRTMLGASDPVRMADHSPARRAGELDIPVLLLHGRRDRIVPLDQSERMAQALEAAGVEHELVVLAGGHALADHETLRAYMSDLLGFLYLHLVQDPAALDAPAQGGDPSPE